VTPCGATGFRWESSGKNLPLNLLLNLLQGVFPLYLSKTPQSLEK
jgi:hypothetical protein